MWGQHGQQRQQNLSWGGALGGNSGAGGAGLGIGALGPFGAFAHHATLPGVGYQLPYEKTYSIAGELIFSHF